jgi:hypothetical protein
MSPASWLFSRADAVASGLSRVDELQCHWLSDYLQVNGLPQTDRVLYDRTRLRDLKLREHSPEAELIVQLARV